MDPFNVTRKSVVCNTESRPPVEGVYETVEWKISFMHVFFFLERHIALVLQSLWLPMLCFAVRKVCPLIHRSLTGFPLTNTKICLVGMAKLESLQSGIKPASMKWLASVIPLCHAKIPWVVEKTTISHLFFWLPTICIMSHFIKHMSHCSYPFCVLYIYWPN